MTPDDNATKRAREFAARYFGKTLSFEPVEFVEAFASEIRAAVEEADRHRDMWLEIGRDAVKQTKAETYAEAAKICDENFHLDGDQCTSGNLIRARAAEEQGDGINTCRHCGKSYLECHEAYK